MRTGCVPRRENPLYLNQQEIAIQMCHQLSYMPFQQLVDSNTSAGGVLTLTWYRPTYMCLPFLGAFREIWYCDLGFSSETKELKLHKLGVFDNNIAISSTGRYQYIPRQGGRKRLPKFRFSAKFPIGLHVILQVQIKKFENDCYIMWKIILTENPSRFNVEPLLK